MSHWWIICAKNGVDANVWGCTTDFIAWGDGRSVCVPCDFTGEILNSSKGIIIVDQSTLSLEFDVKSEAVRRLPPAAYIRFWIHYGDNSAANVLSFLDWNQKAICLLELDNDPRWRNVAPYSVGEREQDWEKMLIPDACAGDTAAEKVAALLREPLNDGKRTAAFDALKNAWEQFEKESCDLMVSVDLLTHTIHILHNTLYPIVLDQQTLSKDKAEVSAVWDDHLKPGSGYLCSVKDDFNERTLRQFVQDIVNKCLAAVPNEKRAEVGRLQGLLCLELEGAFRCSQVGGDKSAVHDVLIGVAKAGNALIECLRTIRASIHREEKP